MSQIACSAAEAKAGHMTELSAINEACDRILAAVKAVSEHIMAQMPQLQSSGLKKIGSGMQKNFSELEKEVAKPCSHARPDEHQQICHIPQLDKAEQNGTKKVPPSGTSTHAAAVAGKTGRLTQFFKSRRQPGSPTPVDEPCGHGLMPQVNNKDVVNAQGLQASVIDGTKHVKKGEHGRQGPMDGPMKVPMGSGKAAADQPAIQEGYLTRSKTLKAQKQCSPTQEPEEAAQDHAGRKIADMSGAISSGVSAKPEPSPWRRKVGAAAQKHPSPARELPDRTSKQHRSSRRQQQHHQPPIANMTEGGSSAPSQVPFQKPSKVVRCSGNDQVSANDKRKSDRKPSPQQEPLKLTFPWRSPDASQPASPKAPNGEDEAESVAAQMHARKSREPLADRVNIVKKPQREGTFKRQRQEVDKPSGSFLDPFAALFAKADEGNQGDPQNAADKPELPGIDEQEIKREVKRRMLMQRMTRMRT